MNETSNLSQELTVEVKDSEGRVKDIRYVSRTGNGPSVEFIPNRVYMCLLKRGVIRSGAWKIPFLLGTRKTEN